MKYLRFITIAFIFNFAPQTALADCQNGCDINLLICRMLSDPISDPGGAAVELSLSVCNQSFNLCKKGCDDSRDNHYPKEVKQCVALSEVGSGSAGRTGQDGSVCMYSCGQLTSLGDTALKQCRNRGSCDLWNDYYVPEIANCCTGGFADLEIRLAQYMYYVK